MKQREKAQIWTRNFISVSLTQFILFTVFYALLMTLPIYVMKELGGSEASAGLIVTFMLISAIIVRPFSAKILDKIGLKKGLVISVSLFSVTTLFYLWIDQFIPLLILRFIHGISFAVVTTASGAIVAQIIPETRRGAGMGYFAMASNIAIVIGPFIGLTLLQYISFRSLFIVLNGLMLISVIASCLVRIPKYSDQEIRQQSRRMVWSDLIEVKALPVAMITGLIGFVYASIISFISIYADELGMSSVAGYFFLVFALVMIAFRPYLGKVFDEKGARIVLIPCLLIFACGLTLLSVQTKAAFFLIAAALIGLGYGTLIPGLQTLAIQSTTQVRSGYAIATFYVLFDIGIATGAFVWGIVIDSLGFMKMYLISAIFVLVITVILNNYLKKTFKQVENEPIT